MVGIESEGTCSCQANIETTQHFIFDCHLSHSFTPAETSFGLPLCISSLHLPTTSHYLNHSFITPNAFNLYFCLGFLLYSIH